MFHLSYIDFSPALNFEMSMKCMLALRSILSSANKKP